MEEAQCSDCSILKRMPSVREAQLFSGDGPLASPRNSFFLSLSYIQSLSSFFVSYFLEADIVFNRFMGKRA